VTKCIAVARLDIFDSVALQFLPVVAVGYIADSAPTDPVRIAMARARYFIRNIIVVIVRLLDDRRFFRVVGMITQCTTFPYSTRDVCDSTRRSLVME
jgi:hypothetical protein